MDLCLFPVSALSKGLVSEPASKQSLFEVFITHSHLKLIGLECFLMSLSQSERGNGVGGWNAIEPKFRRTVHSPSGDSYQKSKTGSHVMTRYTVGCVFCIADNTTQQHHSSKKIGGSKKLNHTELVALAE